ncbi:restriction endonuclease subunit S [Pseudomonas ficuserectae]|jgi:type I restriction enzyme S subunit|uniref:restriction endonuclease subunit S n=1 Tax=Pseudomonas syringae group TaxID=136849 RepID=UPI00069BDA4C|nr:MULTISPECIES: restriction endonuclease subunit S [Pseudomonas syringae group]KPC04792.1 Restriction modification system DNA specificity domain protein [Pseudomonas amygdali pv. lachrymans]RMM45160.1 Restriction modification system DNA specificity domain protein [Pseudomonas amygdali pv. lachrymans]RMO46808.1 Restriction modification system DNA specificity domain protein [Pseudomonas syringae]RMP19572.1 Restriction modification system DNA specificity domain protein [Pseudomonas amygdali pv. l
MQYGNEPWAIAALSDLVSIKTGKLNSNAAVENGVYPFFTCSRETYKVDTYSFDCEAVLLAGNNANGVYPIKYYRGRFDAYQRTYVIRSVDESVLNNRYLFYALQLELDLLQSLSTGSATKFLTLTILNALKVRVPRLGDQNRIVSILGAYDDLIENNTRRIELLEKMARRLYEEWFVQFRFPGHEDVVLKESELGVIPEGWDIQPLYDIAEVTYGHPFKASQFNEDGVGLGIVRIRDIKAGEIKTYTSEEGKPRHLIENGDILIGMDGQFHMGKWAGGQAWLVQRVARFRPKQNGRYFLFLSLERPIKHLENTIVGTTVAHLSAKDLQELYVVIPEKAVLDAASAFLEPIYDLEMKLRRKNANLRTQRDLLLPKLIFGEIDISDIPMPT